MSIIFEVQKDITLVLNKIREINIMGDGDNIILTVIYEDGWEKEIYFDSYRDAHDTYEALITRIRT